MTHKARYIGIGAVMVLMLVTAFALVYTAKANPNFFLQSNAGTATTTVTFMTPGTATTTTAAFDTGAGGAQGSDSAALVECMQASSTGTTLNTTIEYSQDAITWYENNLVSTSTPLATIQSPNSFTWAFASTTVGGGGIGNNNSACKIVPVLTPTKYVRAVFTLPAASKNAAVYGGNFIAKRQNP